MKKTIIILGFLAILSVVKLKAQNFSDSAFAISKFYAGFLYVGTYDDQNQNKWSRSATTKIGLRSEVNAFFGKIIANPWIDNFDVKQMNMHLFYKNELFDFMKFSFGPCLPRPIAIWHRPHPVSWEAHFISVSRDIIPGAGTGASTLFRNIIPNNEVSIGIYEAKKDGKSVIEYDAGINQKFGKTTLMASGYSSRTESGIAAEFQVPYLTVMYFRQSDSLQSNSVYLESAMFNWKVGDLFINTIHNFQDNTFRTLTIGWLYYLDTKIDKTDVHGVFGFGYQIKPKSILDVYFMFYL
jgi:hypothetical protein